MASASNAGSQAMTPRPSETLAQFDEFASAFVRKYWQDVADNVDKLPPYEPCDESVDDILATISYTTSHEDISGQSSKAFVLRMMATSGSIWRFAFKERAGRWSLLAAVANDETDEHRVDLLGEYYGETFRPILERITNLAAG